MKTTVSIGKLELKNPVTIASGTAGYGQELDHYMNIAELGAIFTKGLSLKPRAGNRGNRILETPSGVLNSIGLENVGIEVFLEEKLPFLLARGATPIPNIAGHSIEENVALCKILEKTAGIHAIELNVSCPNVKKGGLAFGQDATVLRSLVEKIRAVTTKTLIIKLSPNVTDIAAFAQVAKDAGADAISAVNTLLGMKIDIKTKKPYFKNKVAGLSGPAIRPVAVRMIYEIYKNVDLPIIALGGIASAEDALEFICAGATAISIGTMNMVQPDIACTIINDIQDYLLSERIDDINSLIGSAHR